MLDPKAPGTTMQWTMNENSLFAILLRTNPLWSFLIAACTIGVMMAVLPEAYRIAGVLSGLPFVVTGCMSAWRRMKEPSAARIARTALAVRAMSSSEFKEALSAAYRNEGYDVQPADGPADFELRKEWRRSLVSCRRWKVARTGVEPLRDLVKAKDAREAHDCLYVAVGEISDNAREFASRNAVSLVGAAELARLITPPKGARKAAASQ